VLSPPFNDPIAQDAIISGRWREHAIVLAYHCAVVSPAQTIPENRVYVSPDRVDAFLRSFLAFLHGTSCLMMREPQALRSDGLRKPTGE